MRKESEHRKYFIGETKDLDPVTVYTEEFHSSEKSGNQGMITIVCFGESWSAFFGGIGDMTLIDFINSCDDHYLANKICNGLDDTLTDYDKLTEGTGIVITNSFELGQAMPELSEHLDDDWYMDMPQKSNPKYEYLMRVVHVVKMYFSSGSNAGSMKMVYKKEWQEFREAGLLWWINRILHTFGWAMCVNVDDDTGDVVGAFPAKVKFRGFDEEAESKEWVKLSEHIKDNADRLVEESKL